MFDPFVPTGPITPHELDEAQLRSMLGGSLHPGIETSWLIRYPELYVEPFRIQHDIPSPYEYELGLPTVSAGFFTRQLAVPWQSDFLSCCETTPEKGIHAGETWYWWPSHRPDWIPLKIGVSTTWEPAHDSKDDYVLKKWPLGKFVVPKSGSLGWMEEQ
jgi:hypothetical protein